MAGILTTLQSRIAASGLHDAVESWMARRIRPQPQITLNRRNIYVLPTRNGLLFLLAAGLVFIAAINYAVSLAYGLAFLMVSLFIITILYTFNNLNNLSLARQPCAPVFCGEEIAFNVESVASKPGSRIAGTQSPTAVHHTVRRWIACRYLPPPGGQLSCPRCLARFPLGCAGW
ncbi:MAG: hypothetical protein ACE37N_08485 [Pseudohongiellaceae bacterium]